MKTDHVSLAHFFYGIFTALLKGAYELCV